MTRVLVTDGDSRAALAVTRSLGRAGHYVVVGERRMPALAQASKYCSHRIQYPDPVTDPEAFVPFLSNLVRDERIDVLLPVADITTFLITRNRDRFETTYRLPFSPAEVIDRAADKVDIVRTAERLGIPVPRGIVVSDADESIHVPFEYPVVVKPHQSRVWANGQWMATSVSFAASPDALRQDLLRRPRYEYPLLIQERIVGPGTGVFALFQRDTPVALFSHRRLRERPPWGGVSVLSESIPLDRSAIDFATRLLREIGWEGVAMVEFKRDVRDNLPKLMEINGRFWGSLQLAVDAGVDFPALLVRAAVGEPLIPQSAYRIGVRTRWLWGDLDALLLALLKNHAGAVTTFGAKLRLVLQFLKLGGAGLHYESPMLRDLGPFWFETRERVMSPLLHRGASSAQAFVAGKAGAHPAGARRISAVAASTLDSPGRTLETVVLRDRDLSGAQCVLDDDTWNRLVAASEPNSVFQTAQWLKTWHAVLGEQREPFLAIQSNGTDVVGLAPLFVDERFGERVLRMLGEGRADYCDLIGEDKRQVVNGLFDTLRRDHTWDELHLSNIPAHSPTVDAVESAATHEGYRFTIEEQYLCPTLVIRGREHDADAIVNKPSVRRRVNALNRLGRVVCRHLTTADDIEPYLDAFFAQHVERWQLTDTPSLFCDPVKQTFYRRLTQALSSSGWLLFTVVELDGHPVAFHYGFDYNESLIWYKPSFDIGLAPCSPGMILMRHLIQYGLEHKRRELDFTVGDEAFKRRFTNELRRTVCIRVFRQAARYAVEVSKQRMTQAVKRAALAGTGGLGGAVALVIQ